MTRRRILREHDFYEVIATEEFYQSVDETFAQLEEKHGTDFASKWHAKISKFIETLQAPASIGIIDPENYSDRYVYRQIPGTETTVFFLVEQDKIFLTTSGYSGRNWPEVLEKKRPQIERQIEILKRQLNVSGMRGLPRSM